MAHGEVFGLLLNRELGPEAAHFQSDSWGWGEQSVWTGHVVGWLHGVRICGPSPPSLMTAHLAMGL
jgi:hypothetical protein